jgi:hypothetical protein
MVVSFALMSLMTLPSSAGASEPGDRPSTGGEAGRPTRPASAPAEEGADTADATPTGVGSPEKEIGRTEPDDEDEENVMPRPVGARQAETRAAPTREGELPRPEGAAADPAVEPEEKTGEPEKKVGAGEPEGGEDAKRWGGGYQPAGPTAVVGGLGFQYGLTDDSVGGFRLGFTYGYRLTDWMWFDAQANFTFGSDCTGKRPAAGEPKEYECGTVHGFGIEAVAGIQWKFYGLEVWSAPVIPFVKAGLGAVAIVSNGPNDGVALVARGSGGARFHFFPWFAVGGELGASLGPAFRNHLDTGFFAAIDFMAGAEFHF